MTHQTLSMSIKYTGNDYNQTCNSYEKAKNTQKNRKTTTNALNMITCKNCSRVLDTLWHMKTTNTQKTVSNRRED